MSPVLVASRRGPSVLVTRINPGRTSRKHSASSPAAGLLRVLDYLQTLNAGAVTYFHGRLV